MPHEVIMPALGMAQESGLIVAWLKKPGDAVKAGDALMEVETDKATMEVEAAADGYLTDVRAAEGQSVPVGEVVAMISDTADGAGDAPDQAGHDAATGASEEAAEDGPAGKDVVMPALGMAQDAGIIVTWLKAPGDRVTADEALLEVETDKATMEVPAGIDGWIAELRGQAGESVAVGLTIALIADEKPANPRHVNVSDAAGGPSDETATDDAAASTIKPEAITAPDDTSGTKAPDSQGRRQPEQGSDPDTRKGAPSGGRILASPKARRLAAERGLDLARLVEAGHTPPFHVADLETLAALPDAEAGGAAAAGASSAQIAAEVPVTALLAFCEWAGTEGVTVTPLNAVAAFAAGALRRANGTDHAIHVGLTSPGNAAATLADPDLSPLGEGAETVDAAPDIVLRDLTGSRVTAVSLGTVAAPTLTLTRVSETFRLTLDFDAGSLDPDAAIALMDRLAARIEEPLRHLL